MVFILNVEIRQASGLYSAAGLPIYVGLLPVHLLASLLLAHAFLMRLAIVPLALFLVEMVAVSLLRGVVAAVTEVELSTASRRAWTEPVGFGGPLRRLLEPPQALPPCTPGRLATYQTNLL
jgi:hypothetical protein